MLHLIPLTGFLHLLFYWQRTAYILWTTTVVCHWSPVLLATLGPDYCFYYQGMFAVEPWSSKKGHSLSAQAQCASFTQACMLHRGWGQIALIQWENDSYYCGHVTCSCHGPRHLHMSYRQMNLALSCKLKMCDTLLMLEFLYQSGLVVCIIHMDRS